MAVTQTFAELEKRLTSEPKEPQIDVDSLDAFSNQLLEIARENGYILHSYYGRKPRVVLLGFSHRGNKINQESELATILLSSLSYGDIINHEGRGPIEVAYEGYHRNDLIGKLKEFLSANDIRVIFNDNNMLLGEFMMASNRLKIAKEEHGKNMNNPCYVEAINNYMQALQNRDYNFCLHESCGIVPLIKGDANNYKQLPPDSRIFQLTGILHVHSGNMHKCLEDANISYIALIPNKKFFD